MNTNITNMNCIQEHFISYLPTIIYTYNRMQLGIWFRYECVYYIIYQNTIHHVIYYAFFFDRYAESVGALHFHTSAKLNHGIEELFLELAKQMIKRTQSAEQEASKKSRVVVVDDELKPKQSCCGTS